MRSLKILVGCEFSGIVRDAFRALGHDAWSCDLLPSEGDSRHHIQADHDLHLLDICYSKSWDLGIFHPPCTYLCNSGVRWLYGGKRYSLQDLLAEIDKDRWAKMIEAATFFKALLNAPIARIAVENPIPHRYALKEIGTPYTQIVQPWQFGEPEVKATCLWLKNLPPLKPTNIVAGRNPRVHHASPGPDRWKERSRTVKGLAFAMAEQWSFT